MSRVIRIFEKTSRALTAPLAERGFTPAPSYLFLELVRKCTHRCNMCNIWKEASDGMALADIRRIFSHKLFDRLERVILTGGEPMLRRDIGEIGGFFAERLPRLNMIAVLTTGFGTKRILQNTRDLLGATAHHPNAPRLVVQVSFDAVGDTYNRIRNIRRAWEETEATVAALQELARTEPRLVLMLHCVIQPLNLGELDQVDGWARAHGLPVLYSLAVISDTYFGNSDLADRLEFTAEEKVQAQAFLRSHEEAVTPEMPLYYEDLAAMLGGATRSRRCMMGYYMIYVRMDGKVYPCVNSGDLLMGDLMTDDPEAVWFARESDEKRRTVRREHCPSCASACYSDITGVKELLAAAQHKVRRLVGA